MNHIALSPRLFASPLGHGVYAERFRANRSAVGALSGHVHARKLARLRRLATLMDDAFQIPFTKFRFGFDGIIGLVPGLGDTVAALISAYIIYDAARMGVPRGMLLRMGSNLAVDYAVGLMPVLGDLLDVAFKANRKNVDLVEAHLLQQLTDGTASAHNRTPSATPSRAAR